MAWYIVKLVVTTALIVSISEISKRSSFAGALLASVPLVSVLGMLWLYIDTGDEQKIISFSLGVFWLVLPSLSLFLTLPLLLKNHLGFYASLAISLAVMVSCYFAMLYLLHKAGVEV